MDSEANKKRLLVITSYPEKGTTHGKQTVGVASYAKNTLKALLQATQNLDITVLAEKLDDSEHSYKDEGVAVKRVWERKSFLTFWHLTAEILNSHQKTKDILLELELAMFGGTVQLLPLPLFLLAMKLSGRKVTIVNHQVISDIDELSGHINREKGSPVLKFYNASLKILYKAELLLASRIIVFDEVFKDKLMRLGSTQKISVIPHGVETFRNVIGREEAKKKLGIKPSEFVILSFGYLAWYKGTDILVQAMKKFKSTTGNKARDTLLILAGGPNTNHMDKKFYQDYIEKIENGCRDTGSWVTGYVSESDIELYYQASDIVVFPYRTLMSSSGPLSIALSFKKPFLVSAAMKEIFETNDVKKIIERLKIDKKDVYFENPEDLTDKLLAQQKNPSSFDKIRRLSDELSQVRSWQIIGKMYRDTLFA